MLLIIEAPPPSKKMPDQMNKKRNPDNKWRSQSKDRYTPKTDTDTEMTDSSPPASLSEMDKQEQPKKEYTKREYSKPASSQNYYNKQPYNRPDSSQGYYNKQPYNEDYQKSDIKKKPYQSPSYARDNKFLFKPKVVKTKDGKHGYNCVPCNSIHDSTLVCMDYLKFKDLTRNVPSQENY